MRTDVRIWEQSRSALKLNRKQIMATHLVTVSPNSFDLPLYISEIPQIDLAAALMQGLAKSVDFTIINTARNLFKTVREEIWLGDCSLDSMAELTSALNEQAFAEASFNAAGSTNAGLIEIIQTLYPLRDDWVEQARDLTSLTYTKDFVTGLPRQNKFTPSDLEEQILNPTVKTSRKTIYRVTTRSAKKAIALNVSPETAAKTLKRALAKKDSESEDKEAGMRNYASGVLHIMHAALRLDREEAITENSFQQLPYPLRYKLITDMIRTCELQAEWKENSNSMSDDDWETFDMLCDKTADTLRTVINSPAFKVAMAQHEAAETQTG